MLDIDSIEDGAAQGAPAYVKWYGAVGLMATIILLHLEILRLLTKMRNRMD